MSYFVFVDNSNVWIEGKVASAVAKGWAPNTYAAHASKIEDSAWRIDFGKLLSFVTDGNVTDIKHAILFGSKPPLHDSLWNAMEKANGVYNAGIIVSPASQKLTLSMYCVSTLKNWERGF